ncbi:MAG: NAD-dependent epimerase/dehydratase family protein [Nitrospirae bacterium YQR-1]
MKKVLVTGGCGFLGSHVCEFYTKRGDEAISFDNLSKHELLRTGFAVEEARGFNKVFLESIGVKNIIGDVRNQELLLDAASGCDYIVHTAAQPAMTISWEDPALDITTNVIGTFNVLESARRHKIPVAGCATIHVYGNKINETLIETPTKYVRSPAGIDETHPTLEGTLTPLHASKAAGDIYTRAYIDTYGVKAASFRLTGIYGSRQFGGEDHGWVANFSIRTVLNQPITVFGTGKQVRDIIYATDVCRAFEAFYNSQVPGIYNIGGGLETALSLRQCIDILSEITTKRPEVRFDKDRHGDLRYFVCNIDKARKHLEWSPEIKPREGIEMLVDWINSTELFFKPNHPEGNS